MLVTTLLEIIINFMTLVINELGARLPHVDLTEIYNNIDFFITFVASKGLDAFNLIAGPVPFILAPIILTLYSIYYFVLIPIKLIIRFFVKGT